MEGSGSGEGITQNCSRQDKQRGRQAAKAENSNFPTCKANARQRASMTA